MASQGPEHLSADSMVLCNLNAAKYKRTVFPLEERVVSLATHNYYAFIGTVKFGCRVFRIDGNEVKPLCVLGEQAEMDGRSEHKQPVGGSTCYDVTVSDSFVVYVKESSGKCQICVHSFNDVIRGHVEVIRSHDLTRRAPLVVEPDLGLIVIAGLAWKSSWTSGKGGDLEKGGEECNLRVMNLLDFSLVREFKVVDNSVSMLRLQLTSQYSMLGASDSRAGLYVCDLRQPTPDGYAVLYHVPVEEVRSFQLVGNFVGVFHKFEPNVTFWNMMEQKTILCINIQEQMKQLVEEFYEEEDDDSGLFEDDDDHVTAVACIPVESDFLLIYGTRSGCIFGMSVDKRTKVFSIPFPHDTVDQHKIRRDVEGLSFMPDGKMVVCYEGAGLTVLDFGLEDPPDRPPTRGQPK